MDDIDHQLTDPGFFATGDPHTVLRRLRAEDPVHWTEGALGFWSVTKYADVLAVAIDRRTFSAERSGIALPLVSIVPAFKMGATGSASPSWRRCVPSLHTPFGVGLGWHADRILLFHLVKQTIDPGTDQRKRTDGLPIDVWLGFSDTGHLRGSNQYKFNGRIAESAAFLPSQRGELDRYR